MPKVVATLDEEGRLHLVALGAAYRPGDWVEFIVTGDAMVIRRSLEAVSATPVVADAAEPASRSGPRGPLEPDPSPEDGGQRSDP